MDGNLVLVTAPAVEPITVADAARQLRVAETTGERKPAAPTVALISPAAAGNVDNGTHRYRVTFVTAIGATEAGDVSEVVTVADKTVNGKVTVSNIPIGSASVTSRKLYRTIASGSDYLLLTTIADNTTTTYTDNTADSGLGAGAPSTNTTDDTYITSLIKGARQQVEGDTRRALCTQTWDLKFDGFPSDGLGFRIPRPPVQSITSITYTDTDGDSQTVPTADYVVSITDAYCDITLAQDADWPSDVKDQANAVVVRFATGYGVASAVPEGLKAAVRIAAAQLYISPNPAGSQLTVPTREQYDDTIAPFVVLRLD